MGIKTKGISHLEGVGGGGGGGAVGVREKRKLPLGGERGGFKGSEKAQRFPISSQYCPALTFPHRE